MIAFFRITIVFYLLVGLWGCQLATHNNVLEKVSIQGKTMGTTYHITYIGSPYKKVELNQKVNLLLEEINAQVSTYISTSTISLFNKSDSIYCISKTKKHFMANFNTGLKIAKATHSSFDPTIMPLVNYWGFGYTTKKQIEDIDSLEIAQRLTCVGIEKIQVKTEENICFTKTSPCTQLDFSAIAKGYGVDMVSLLLIKEGFNNHLVEIGGELVAKGTKPNHKKWTAGISKPVENENQNSFEYIVKLDDKGLATSGNYRNFYKSNGATYSHTINPKTGFPERSNLLSATVIASNCMTADAYATAYMTMGLQRAITHVNNDKNLEAFFIFVGQDGELFSTKSEGFEGLIEQ